MANKSYTICVCAASSQPHSTQYREDLLTLGRNIALGGHHLVMGGMANGSMGVVGQSFLEHGGTATIITPDCYVDSEASFMHEKLLRETTPDVMTRINAFIAKTDGFIVCPGGIGSIGEYPNFIAVNQGLLYQPTPTHKQKPTILYNRDSFYDPLLEQYKVAHKHGYISAEHMQLIQSAYDVKNLIPTLEKAIAAAQAA